MLNSRRLRSKIGKVNITEMPNYVDRLQDSKRRILDRFKIGDLVVPYYGAANGFYGVVIDIDKNICKLYVDFNGTVTQVDPQNVRVDIRQAVLEGEDFIERGTANDVGKMVVFDPKRNENIFIGDKEVVNEDGETISNLKNNRRGSKIAKDILSIYYHRSPGIYKMSEKEETGDISYKCPKCKGKMKINFSKNNGTFFECEDCGKKIYNNKVTRRGSIK